MLGPLALSNGGQLKPPLPPGLASRLRHLESGWFGAGARAKVRPWDAEAERCKAGA